MSQHSNETESAGNSVREPRCFKNMPDVLPEFNPVGDGMPIRDWIERMEEFGELYGWDNVAIQHYALSKLVGVAKTWRDSIRPKPTSWEGWKAVLCGTFTIEESRLTCRIQAQNYKWRPNQDIVEYFFEKLSKCNKCDMSNSETIEWIVHGIGNVRYREFLGPLSRYMIPTELLPHLKEASKFIRDSNNSATRCYESPGTRRNFNNNGSNNKSKSREIICFKCNMSGHYARNCPRGRNDQHSGSASAISEVGVSSTKTILNLKTISSTHNKYFKNAVLNNKLIKSYIDLGSSCVTIRADIANELNLSFYECITEALVGYGKGKVQPLGLFTGILTIDNVQAKVQIHVVPSDSQEVPLLVGHPFTEQPHVVITSTSDNLRIEYAEGALPNADDIPSQSQESTTVPNNYIGRICVSTELPNREICVVGDVDDKEANDSDKYEPENKNDEKTGQVESTEEDEKMDTSDISMVVDEDVKLTEKQETNVEENAHVEVISSSIENKTNLDTKSNVDVDKKDNEIKSLEETCEKSTEENETEKLTESCKDLSQKDIKEASHLEVKDELPAENPQMKKMQTKKLSAEETPPKTKEEQKSDKQEIQIESSENQESHENNIEKSSKMESQMEESQQEEKSCIVVTDASVDVEVKAIKVEVDANIIKSVDDEEQKLSKANDKTNSGNIEKMETELIEKENDSKTDDKEKISEDVRKIGSSIEEKEKSCKYEEDIVDDKLWPDVDKDLGDLLREAELSDRSSDEGEENSKTVEDSLEKNKLKMRKRYNKHKKKLCKSGDLVMVRSAIPGTGQSRKLEPKYRGPYTVVKSIGNDRYLVDDIEGERQSGHIYKGILSSDRLKLVPK